jgi:predicted O-linked N-acetylglucosamine transferase (SPINDLY family)
VTLGCLNNPCKLTARTLELWARVMQALPAARLVLMAPEGRHRDQLAARFAAAGIAPSRVAFVPFQPRLRYLETYHAIDIGLDTLPYNGHTTSLDAFWMGVPVVTRVGSTCAGRGGLSQLVQLGLAELAATTDEDYVGAVVRLATDLDSLRELRAALRERLVASPLMDAPRFARALEGAYREAWRLAYADAPAGH